MYSTELQYTIAVSLLKRLGAFNAKKLIEAFGSAEAVFNESPHLLSKLKISRRLKEQLRSTEPVRLAEEEIEYLIKHNVTPYLWTNESYPYRLSQCPDGPLVIYTKGNGPINPEKAISIVGTRRATPYGKSFVSELIRGLSETGVQVVSGLALGIDTAAHREALKNGLSTIGVLGHGMDRLYPRQNRQLSIEMQESGLLITDFATSADFLPGNFPARNRIIAGLTDATIVVESGVKGGSIITAELANTYNREVFALPGIIKSENSSGCNALIKNNRAALIESPEDLLRMMNWKDSSNKKRQHKLFEELSAEETSIVKFIREKGQVRIDEISTETGQTISNSASALLDLEFRNVVKSLPGKMYALA